MNKDEIRRRVEESPALKAMAREIARRMAVAFIRGFISGTVFGLLLAVAIIAIVGVFS